MDEDNISHNVESRATKLSFKKAVIRRNTLLWQAIVLGAIAISIFTIIVKLYERPEKTVDAISEYWLFSYVAKPNQQCDAFVTLKEAVILHLESDHDGSMHLENEVNMLVDASKCERFSGSPQLEMYKVTRDWFADKLMSGKDQLIYRDLIRLVEHVQEHIEHLLNAGQDKDAVEVAIALFRMGMLLSINGEDHTLSSLRLAMWSIGVSTLERVSDSPIKQGELETIQRYINEAILENRDRNWNQLYYPFE